MLVSDPLALHETLLFRELNAARTRGPIARHAFGTPKILRLPPRELDTLAGHRELFRSLGFEWERFGEGEIALECRPERLPESEVEETLVKSLRRVESGSFKQDPGSLVLAEIAASAAVSSTRALTALEAERLLEAARALPRDERSPHGKPVTMRLSFHSIEKSFERV